MGSIDPLGRMEQAAKRMAVSIDRDWLDSEMHQVNATLDYREDFSPALDDWQILTVNEPLSS